MIARNYVARARVLAESFLEHHPGGRVSVLLLDPGEDFEDAQEPFDVLRPADVGLDRAELHRMAAIYSLLELATAVKPWLISRLLDDGAPTVVYLDPDIEVFAPLEGADRLAAEHSIVLTPHLLEPMTRDDRYPSETDILGAGVYNLGFLAVGAGAARFLRWWRERLRRDCLHEPARGYFLDQRWIDVGAVLFRHHVLRDPGCNVAYWNLDRRHIVWTGDRYLVNGRPLRFFHFSGFRPEHPWVLSVHQRDRPRVRPVDNLAVARLCQQYAHRLHACGQQDWTGMPEPFASAVDGTPLDRRTRRAYRQAVLAHDAGDGAEAPPDPFDPHDAARFAVWRRDEAAQPWITRHVRDLRDTAGRTPERIRPTAKRVLQAVGVEPSDALRLARLARRQADVVHQRLARVSAWQPRAEGRPTDVNVVGYFKAESGMGELARLLGAALDHAGIGWTAVNVDSAASRQLDPFSTPLAPPGPAATNIVCVNADLLLRLPGRLRRNLFGGPRTVAVWAWELESHPAAMSASAALVDEIWALSAYSAEAMAGAVSKPVSTFPVPVVHPDPAPMDRASWGLAEGFVFLCCFDANSVVERKNPMAVVEAFSRAFAPGEGPTLVVKSVSGERDPSAMWGLHRAAAARPDVVIVDGYLSRKRHLALVRTCDTYVSLHRAEGFGLTLAEAMALGKPVIATGYSGNMEFMDPSTSWLVPYRLSPVPAGCSPYPAGARWAEPDVDVAAVMMRDIHDHRQEAAARAGQARDVVVSRRSVARAGEWLLRRLEG